MQSRFLLALFLFASIGVLVNGLEERKAEEEAPLFSEPPGVPSTLALHDADASSAASLLGATSTESADAVAATAATAAAAAALEKATSNDFGRSLLSSMIGSADSGLGMSTGILLETNAEESQPVIPQDNTQSEKVEDGKQTKNKGKGKKPKKPKKKSLQDQASQNVEDAVRKHLQDPTNNHHVVAVNSNTVKRVHRTLPRTVDFSNSEEESLKHVEEEHKKQSVEEYRKRTREESVKDEEELLKRNRKRAQQAALERDLQQKQVEFEKITAEQQGKNTDHYRKSMDEQATKTSIEEKDALARAQEIKIEESNKQKLWKEQAQQKQKQLEKEESQIDLDFQKQRSEENKKFQEQEDQARRAQEFEREALAHREKVDEETRKLHELRERKREERKKREEASKREEEQKVKHKQEQQAKAVAEQNQKRIQEQNQKAAIRNNLRFHWCHCQHIHVPFANQGWHTCPGGKFLVGLHRHGRDDLAGLDHFACCSACRPNTGEVVAAAGCTRANWWASFDREGWSHCPGNTYVTGLYKNHCHALYCLEEAVCCGLPGSRGDASCSRVTRWWSTLDRPGWSMIDGHRFIRGFYRTGGHHLHNLEEAYQCEPFVY